MNRQGFEFSFGWLFAIIVGALIIFLGVYAASRLAYSEGKARDSSLAKEFGTILSPLETGIEESKVAPVNFPSEVKLNNFCNSVGNFGEQKISISSRSGIGREWQSAGSPSTFYGKYIFSEKTTEGKEFIVFSKPFEMPFKIGDLIFIFPEKSI